MKATLTTLTPVHIGSGTTYNKNIDFFQNDGKIGIIDEAKVLKFIGKENIHQWTAAIERGGEAFGELLMHRGWKGDLQSICSRIMPLRNVEHSSTQLKEVFRTPLKGLCIPGSSLKGALRTAIFNSFLDEDFLKKISIKQIATIKEKKNWKTNEIFTDYKFNDNTIQKKVFGNNANENSMRFLKIGDINLEQTQAEVHELKVLNKYGDKWNFKRDSQTLIEAIPAGVQAEFDFIIDEKLYKENLKYNANKWNMEYLDFIHKGKSYLCEIINFITKGLIKTDYYNLKEENKIEQGIDMVNQYAGIFNSFKNIDKSNEFIIRIGGNSGYLFTTGQWVDNEGMEWFEDDYMALRKTIQKKDYSNMDLWPKTRKISSSGQIFGFVKVTLQG